MLDDIVSEARAGPGWLRRVHASNNAIHRTAYTALFLLEGALGSSCSWVCCVSLISKLSGAADGPAHEARSDILPAHLLVGALHRIVQCICWPPSCFTCFSLGRCHAADRPKIAGDAAFEQRGLQEGMSAVPQLDRGISMLTKSANPIAACCPLQGSFGVCRTTCK